MSKGKSIIILSAPRSGTNHFCDTLGNFDNIANLFEIFNPRGVFGISHYPTLVEGFNVTPPSSPNNLEIAQYPKLIKSFRERPVLSVEMISSNLKHISKEYVSYKIFPNQISEQALLTLLRDQAHAVLFIVRCRISSYISYKKAMENDVWHNVDTNTINISVDPEDFLNWCAELDNWYLSSLALVRRFNTPFCIFSYEADINTHKSVLLEKISLGLKAIGIDLPYPTNLIPENFKRQDRASNPFEKIGNSEKLIGFLEERGLFRYALSNSFLIDSTSDLDN